MPRRAAFLPLVLALHDPNDHPDNDDDEDDGGKRQQYPSHREAEEPPLGVKRHGHWVPDIETVYAGGVVKWSVRRRLRRFAIYASVPRFP